ncbi:MAG: DUF1963 domain-containing protein, partial [Terricaulis sp.]
GIALTLLAGAADAQQPSRDEFRERFMALMNRTPRPAIAIIRGRPTPNITTNSYYGGLPRMPANLQWPVSTLTNQPMFFVAQINLADLPAIADRQGLPESGTLWFFLAYDGIVEERERVAVLYDPRSGERWPERPAPAGLQRIIDESPYMALEASDPLAQLDLPSPMRFAAVTDLHPQSASPEDDAEPGDVDAEGRARRQEIESALGPMTNGPSGWEAPHELDIEEWPYAGFTAELAAGVVEEQLPPLTIYERAEPGTTWSRQGRRLREQIAQEAREQRERWRRTRFEPLTAEQRAEFRAWMASVITRANAIPRTQTGGWGLYYSITNYTIRQTDLFAGYAGLARGTDIALPPRYRASYDWIGSDPPLDQMLGFGWSDQSAPMDHAIRDVLLLQIEGGDNVFWLPECVLHFWIPRQALAVRRFDYTSTTLECD